MAGLACIFLKNGGPLQIPENWVTTVEIRRCRQRRSGISRIQCTNVRVQVIPDHYVGIEGRIKFAIDLKFSNPGRSGAIRAGKKQGAS